MVAISPEFLLMRRGVAGGMEAGLNVQANEFPDRRLTEASPKATDWPVSKKALRVRLYLALGVVDGLALLLGVVVGNIIRLGDPFHPQGMNIYLMLLPIYIGTAINSRAYCMDALIASRQGIVRAIASLLFAVGAITFLAFYMRSGLDMSRIVLGVGAVVAAGLIVVGRELVGLVSDRVCGGSPLSEVVIQAGQECSVARGAFVVDAQAAGLRPDLRDPMMLDRIGRLLKNADRVIVGCSPEDRARWAFALKGANIDGELVAAEVDELGTLGIGRYGASATIIVAAGPLNLRDRALKRVFDLSIALPALLLLSPVMLIVAGLIKVTSPGPFLFVQPRLGRGNRMFNIYKFRSMRADRADGAGNRSASRDDDRITTVGRVIRKTSLDELPQILNVIRGEMSLVGPRPHALGSIAGDALFWEVDSRYWHRHASKPGLTGLAQVRGFRGATHQRSDLVNRLQADLEYQSGWTLWRDILIIIATVKVLVHRNAY
jgi:lipopolysaccharide/colanic/teichoic acid biosynthesis glycosyltransferase